MPHASRAPASPARKAASYSALLHGQGSGTSRSGSPAALAWARIRSSRTPCIALRPSSGTTVVTRPTTAPSPATRSSCRAQAASLPPLHESKIRLGDAISMDAGGNAHDDRPPRRQKPCHLLVILIEQVLYSRLQGKPGCKAVGL